MKKTGSRILTVAARPASGWQNSCMEKLEKASRKWWFFVILLAGKSAPKIIKEDLLIYENA